MAAARSDQGGDKRAADTLLPRQQGRGRRPWLVMGAHRWSGTQHHPLHQQVPQRMHAADLMYSSVHLRGGGGIRTWFTSSFALQFGEVIGRCRGGYDSSLHNGGIHFNIKYGVGGGRNTACCTPCSTQSEFSPGWMMIRFGSCRKIQVHNFTDSMNDIADLTAFVCCRAKAFVFATKSDFTAAEALSFLDRHSHKADYGS